jgi:hypothetical protein
MDEAGLDYEAGADLSVITFKLHNVRRNYLKAYLL